VIVMCARIKKGPSWFDVEFPQLLQDMIGTDHAPEPVRSSLSQDPRC
jgi:hypothetical protein